MPSDKKRVADLLFGVQIIAAVIMTVCQFQRLLTTTAGQLVSMFLVMGLYHCLHLALAIGAHRAQASRTTRQTIGIYVVWLVLTSSNIVAIGLNGHYRWSDNDTKTGILVLLGGGLVWIVARLCRLTFVDPLPKSLLAMLCKVVPQLAMAFEIADKGGAGVLALIIIGGNLTILLRVAQVGLTIREAGWDRNRLWLFVSEVANEISWLAVSIVWVIWLIGS